MKSPGQIQREFLETVYENGGKIERLNLSVTRDFVATNRTYHITLRQNGNLTLVQLSWTPELEEYLLFERPTCASSFDEEAERFATVLANNLATLEDEVGKDYAEAVFVELLRERDYDLHELLDKAATPRPSRDGVHYENCRLYLANAIDGLQNSAIFQLAYNGEEATKLMTEALKIVVDERFYISERDRWFPSA